MSRAQRRAQKKKMSKDEQKISDKIFQFNQLPDECNICKKAFDKQDRAMVESWSVVVRDAKRTVSLFCPTCLEKTHTYFEEKT
tara:strand:+ start:136 stop:384 length:249 start_codon:yes stop_codon:yes gene_type:complete